ncbi:hypothetical protein GCM10007385_35260 [Tateyamaria omphalii]|uniref:AsnC family protein n=1 Tax=Tateyamaria omphalii TaxID=299262 RepID=UPI001673BBD3|nr:AsnC family protein [Tateyamaria omphalii]GGX63077.1 hypothetical protein GCM10007385_35260 [Tateyamaria omphalii]
MTTTCPDHIKLPAVCRVRTFPRSHDEQILAALDQRTDGRRWPEIATNVGMTTSACTNACNKVVREDVEFSGESRASVMAGYW